MFTWMFQLNVLKLIQSKTTWIKNLKLEYRFQNFIEIHWFSLTFIGFSKKGSYVKMVCMSIFKVPVRVSVLHKIVPFCSVPNCSCSVPFWVRHYPYQFRIEPNYLERKLNRVFVPVNCTLILLLPAISSSIQWF